MHRWVCFCLGVLVCVGPSTAQAECKKSSECAGTLLCVDGRCQDPSQARARSGVRPPVRPAVSQPPGPVLPPPPALGEVQAAVSSPPQQSAVDYYGKTQWFGIRSGGGNYGGGITMHLFTVRWKWFYLVPIALSGGGGGPGKIGYNRPSYYGKGGVRLGIPFHFGAGGRHEIRVGGGVSGGIAVNQIYRTWWQTLKVWKFKSHGPFVEVELLYEYHITRWFSLQIGLEVSVPMLQVNENYYEDDWKPKPIFFGFVGCAF